jgi:hypothetical protein
MPSGSDAVAVEAKSLREVFSRESRRGVQKEPEPKSAGCSETDSSLSFFLNRFSS